MTPRKISPAALVLALALLVSGCGRPLGAASGHAQSDRAAEVLVTAISYPRQDDSTGWARAAQETSGGRRGEVVVLRAEDLAARDLTDPSARLVFLIHSASEQDTFGEHPALDTCYRATFNGYGVIGGPRRVACPPHPQPLQLPSAPPSPQIPVAFDRVVATVLRHAAATPDPDVVRRDLLSRLGAPAPEVDVRVSGSDVGVALRTADACQLGSRVDDRIRVYDPPRVTVQPGEMSCDAVTAMGPTLEPPH